MDFRALMGSSVGTKTKQAAVGESFPWADLIAAAFGALSFHKPSPFKACGGGPQRK